MKYLLRKRFLIVFVITITLMSQLSYAVPEVDKGTDNGFEDVMGLPLNAAEEAPNAVAVVTPVEPKITTGIVAAGTLNVRENPGTDQKLVGKVFRNMPLKIVKSENGWYQVVSESISGWVSGDYVSNVGAVTEKQYKEQISRGQIDRSNPPAASSSGKVVGIVELTKQQIGKPYVYGSSGPNAFDCSGLMCYVFGKNGISLPRSSASYLSLGKTIPKANLQPGDIVLLDTVGAINGGVSHVGLYVGNRQIIHAATGGRGVVYDNIDAPYYAQRYIKSVRVL